LIIPRKTDTDAILQSVINFDILEASKNNVI